MIYEKCFDYILNGYEVETPEQETEVLDNVIYGIDWSEIETRDSSIGYGRFIKSAFGIDVYYDYAADYYFFCDANEEEGSAE